jgi:large subunit ribosomal protein L4
MADTSGTINYEAAAFSAQGTPRERVALPTATFDGTVNVPVMHQAVKAYLANQRQGNAATKTRGLVVGGNQKPWRQKGTGRARQGSTRAPHWVGGGTVFGPHPRKYTETVTRQVRALARKSAFNARAREGALYVIDAFQYDAPKTARLQQLLARLDVANRKVLILTDGVKPNVFLSGRNLPNTHVLPFGDVSTYHLIWSDVVLVEAAALGHEIAPMAEKELAKVKVKRFVKRVGVSSPDEGTEDVPEAKGEARTVKRESRGAAKRAPRAAKKAPAKAKGTAKKHAAPKAKAAARKPAARKAAPKKKGK